MESTSHIRFYPKALAVYNRTIIPANHPRRKSRKAGEANEWLFQLLAAVLLVGVIIAAWSNHFENGFHFDDQQTIVDNDAVHHLSNVPKFFSDPRTFSSQPEHADYRPVLSTLFAIDYNIGGEAFLYQAENFLWLLIEVLLVYFLVIAIPGVSNGTALLTAGICGLHPALAEVVNYPLQRSYIVGAAGICAGMLFWIVWPRKLPAELPMQYRQFPRNRAEERLRWLQPRLARAWPVMLRVLAPFYLAPVLFAILAEPSASVFPLIMLAWIVLFEGSERKSRVLPSALLCGSFWVVRAVWILKLTAGARLPVFSFWYTQPWVAVRFILRSFFPVHLSATMSLTPLDQPWSPLALAGYAGVATVLGLAIATSRRPDWRVVSFGLWWFLIAFTPQALIPQYAVNSDGRILIPLIGLAIAASAAGLVLVTRAGTMPKWKPAAEAAAWVAASAIVCLFAWKTHERNPVWATDESFWQDEVVRSPNDGVAMLNYGQLLVDRGDVDRGFPMLERGAALMPDDTHAVLTLAHAYSKLNRDDEAEKYFRSALHGNRSAPWSDYAEWLEAHQRHEEALKLANQALAMNRNDVAARHIVMEEMSANYQWDKLGAYAGETLKIAPQDEPAKRSLIIAQMARDEIRKAEKQAAGKASLDALLNLSVVYFRNGKFEEAVRTARKAIVLDPNQPFAYSNLSAAYHAMGRTDDSIAALREGLKLDPNLPNAKENLEFELSTKSEQKP